MYSFHKIRTAAGTLVVGFLLAIAFTATAQAGGLTAQQQKADKARAQAMDRFYHLGKFSPAALALAAEKRRSQAMDRYYGLSGLTAQQQKADKARAVATDRFYHLGSYAVISSSSPFQWSDAGIGAGAMLGTILVAGGLAVTLRRRGGGKPSIPRST
jgi:hypothetical protein